MRRCDEYVPNFVDEYIFEAGRAWVKIFGMLSDTKEVFAQPQTQKLTRDTTQCGTNVICEDIREKNIYLIKMNDKISPLLPAGRGF